MMTSVRAKSPLRLGLAGGGTDVSPYCDVYGGNILNVTISLFTYCTLIPTNDGKIVFESAERNERFETGVTHKIPVEGELILHKGVYNKIIEKFNIEPFSFRLITWSDAPAGSGLGTSSTLVVTILQAFKEFLNLALGEYDLAMLAYQIERIDVGLAGGKQDQYSAAFGGINFIEFYGNDRVIVNPLRIKSEIISELECSTLLYFTGVSRSSAEIIDDQTKSLASEHESRLLAMHKIKHDALVYKDALLKGDLKTVFNITGDAYEAKKQTSSLITNDFLDEIYKVALNAGCYSGKISGAGGGGVFMLFVDPVKRYDVINALKKYPGKFLDFHFVQEGAISWKF
jgi:D-glycero-alpha-D-manno-heptose-7-phosphate kinase